jgi:3-phosphoshikimate 1-carboxyvinyltransferase
MPGIEIKARHIKDIKTNISLNGSKSISNRLLIIEALCGEDFKISNLSNAADTVTLDRLLRHPNEQIMDAGDAGTTYRFLTAFLALQEEQQLLTGSKRMLERPIKILVEALKELGADIQYVGKEGYPPLQIGEGNFQGDTMPHLNIPAGVSSQYISALLLIAPVLPQGLRLQLEGEIVSAPYIEMTLELMEDFGVESFRAGNSFMISPQSYVPKNYAVEADWSAASYYYSIAALAEGAVELELEVLKKDSLQGDAVIAEIMQDLGVETRYLEEGKVLVCKNGKSLPKRFDYDFTACPDLAQTIAALLAGLQIPAKLTGLQTLRIKETDRIAAMKAELEKLGAKVETGEDWMEIKKGIDGKIAPKTLIETYKDHRMAMAIAPLALKLGKLKFDHKKVVNKSYPAFWDDLKKLGFK